MTNPSSKKADSFLQTESQELQSIFTKVKLLRELNQKVSAYLDINSVPYCQVANLVGNKLILVAANGSIATQIRFQSVDLLRKFKQDPALRNIQSIECKVRPVTTTPTSRPSPTGQTMESITTETAHMIREMAKSIEDTQLREIMLRIASRTKVC